MNKKPALSRALQAAPGAGSEVAAAALNRRPPRQRPARLLAALLLAVAGAGVAGQTPPAGTADPLEGGWLERLQEKLDRTRSFRARFTQEYEPRAFSRRQTEGGTVVFLRPGRIRWDYEWPEPKLALCDGAQAWIYLPDEKRAEVEPLEALGDDAPAVQILLGRWRLRDRFRLEAVSRAQGEITLHLVPEPAVEAVKAVRIALVEADLTLRAVETEEAGGNLLRYRFEGWEDGVPVSEAVFRFEPPAGVEVAVGEGARPSSRSARP